MEKFVYPRKDSLYKVFSKQYPPLAGTNEFLTNSKEKRFLSMTIFSKHSSVSEGGF